MAAQKPVAAADKVTIPELVRRLADKDYEAGRAAKRTLYQMVRRSGRPGAAAERRSTIDALVPFLTGNHQAVIKREVLGMLSLIGGDESVPAIAALLDNAELREDARMALERIPGDRSLAALLAGLKTAPAEFQPNLAQSIRARGRPTPGFPSLKLRPSKPTRVQPVKSGQ